MKMKLNNKKMELVRRRFDFLNGVDISTEGSRRGLCVAWKENCMAFLKSYSSNHVDMEIVDGNTDETLWFTGLYRALYANGREDAWRLLKSLKNSSSKWLKATSAKFYTHLKKLVVCQEKKEEWRLFMKH